MIRSHVAELLFVNLQENGSESLDVMMIMMVDNISTWIWYAGVLPCDIEAVVSCTMATCSLRQRSQEDGGANGCKIGLPGLVLGWSWWQFQM